MNIKLAQFIALPVLALAAVACASQTPPAAETPTSHHNAPEESEHTMPDGTAMEGQKHGEPASHTMPDGTVMPGQSHHHGESSGGEE